MASETQHGPWGPGGAQRADRIIIAGIALSGIWSLALLPLVPSLVVAHPALLELLRGSTVSMVNMGALARTGQTSLALALVAALPTLIAFDWLFWWAGRRWGDGAVELLLGRRADAARRAARLERVMARFGAAAVTLAYLLPVPTALVYVAAGWSGMRLRVFLALDVLGATLWIALNVGLGFAIGQRAVDVANAVARYALVSTLGIVVLVMVWQLWRARKAAGAT